jgi:hypothetical protein
MAMYMGLVVTTINLKLGQCLFYHQLALFPIAFLQNGNGSLQCRFAFRQFVLFFNPKLVRY